jgi:hypothetical protein
LGYAKRGVNFVLADLAEGLDRNTTALCLPLVVLLALHSADQTLIDALLKRLPTNLAASFTYLFRRPIGFVLCSLV